MNNFFIIKKQSWFQKYKKLKYLCILVDFSDRPIRGLGGYNLLPPKKMNTELHVLCIIMFIRNELPFIFFNLVLILFLRIYYYVGIHIIYV